MLFIIIPQIPIAEEVWWDKLHPLAALFRVFMPVFLFFLALLTTRLYPLLIISHLQQSQGFDSVPPKMIANPLAV